MTKNLKACMLVCASMLAASAAYASGNSAADHFQMTQQAAKIKGTIVDSKTGEPIIGASVKVKGTNSRRLPMLMDILSLMLLRGHHLKCLMWVIRTNRL